MTRITTIAERIRFAAQDKNMSMTDLAKVTGLRVSSLRLMASGLETPTLKQLKTLAEALGTTLPELRDQPYEYQANVTDLKLDNQKRHEGIVKPLPPPPTGQQQTGEGKK